jgi:Uma2 family endonuclease
MAAGTSTMSAITTRPRTSGTVPSSPSAADGFWGEKRILLRGLSWELYDRLSDAIGEGQNVRLTYACGDLEIMTTGNLHEDFKELFGRLVNAVTVELDIPCKSAGQTTWKRPGITRGLEADQCYYFAAATLAAVAEALARKSNDVADYPNPDLAIEIDLSPPEIDRADIYGKLKISEVWRFDGHRLVIEH